VTETEDEAAVETIRQEMWEVSVLCSFFDENEERKWYNQIEKL